MSLPSPDALKEDVMYLNGVLYSSGNIGSMMDNSVLSLGTASLTDDAPIMMKPATPLLDKRNGSIQSGVPPLDDRVVFGSPTIEDIEKSVIVNLHSSMSASTQRLDQEEARVEYVPVVPDGGWGWMVLLGTVIVNTLIPGLIKSFGVLFVEFLRVFDASPSAASWIPALSFSLYNLLGPVASALSNRYSCRRTTIAGGISASVGLLLSYYANSIQVLYFSYGILGGIGAGLSYTPGVLIVGRYFEKHRGFANGICMSGSALGSIILPPFLNYLMSQYGFRGAILIMSAVILNVCVGASLYQPVERHMKWVKKESVAKDEEEEILLVNGQLAAQPPSQPGERKVSWHISTTDKPSQPAENNVAKTQPVENNVEKNAEMNDLNTNSKGFLLKWLKSDSDVNPRTPLHPVREDESHHEDVRLKRNLLDSKDKINMKRDYSAAELTAPSNNVTPLPKIPTNSSMTFGSKPTLFDYPMSSRTPRLRRNTSVASTLSNSSSLVYQSGIIHGSTLAAYQHTDVAKLGSVNELKFHSKQQGKDEEVPCPKAEKESTWSKLFDFRLLKNTVFMLINYSYCCSGIAYTNLIILLPAYAHSCGYKKSDYAMLLSIVAGSDLVGRLLSACLADLRFFSRKYFYICGMFVSAVALCFIGVYNSYQTLAIWCAVFGLSSGSYIGLMAVILVDKLGADRLASTFGLTLAFNGLVMLAGPPTVAVLLEHIGSYRTIFYILGTILGTGAVVWVLEPFATKYERRKEEMAAEPFPSEMPNHI